MYAPTLDEMRALRAQGNLCPIYREILADLETPVSAYLKLAQAGPSFLLESVTGGQNVGRYSFIGGDPYQTLRMHDGVAQATQGGYKQTLQYEDPLLVLDSYLNAYRPVRIPGLPIFVGGAVGYLAYEAARCFERLPMPAARAYDMPDSWWMFVDTILVFDHVKHKILVISHAHLDAEDLAAEYQRAVGKIEAVIARLMRPLPQASPAVARNYEPHSVTPAREPVPVASNRTREEFEQAVLVAKEYVMAGDIFQVQISQRFSKPTAADSFTIYRALRTINPSPYMFYIRTGEGDLVGASPEMLVQVQDGNVETRPIAGTRWRGKDTAEDERLAAELLADEKERAEHLMLVDLGRNDVGRISEPGTVEVPTFMVIEKYSHVQHIVSAVTGKLRADLKPLDALRACFPAGTVTGAPKIRAMEVIAELEQQQRGVYAGAVGHVGFNGDLDTCIALRTLIVKDGVAYAQAAAGVVADSTPEYEYVESCNKAAASLRAIDAADDL
ncbi:anthranilate synthase component I [Chloroflexales bacterium ZM16-3]|nr:anthranilate synthase component I [Chloroflexales bacterium ZM16-3]